jgi:hypothetical protein
MNLATNGDLASSQLDVLQNRQLPRSVSKPGSLQYFEGFEIPVILFVIRKWQPGLKIDWRLFVGGK